MGDCQFNEYMCTNPHCRKKTITYASDLSSGETEGFCFYCGAKTQYYTTFGAYDF